MTCNVLSGTLSLYTAATTTTTTTLFIYTPYRSLFRVLRVLKSPEICLLMFHASTYNVFSGMLNLTQANSCPEKS